MVAYSFAPQFVEAVSTLEKRQTVRADRTRHARPGEAIQLYTGMRTKRCRKLVDIDPIVIDVRHIAIDIDPAKAIIITAIRIDGVHLDHPHQGAFAFADGFGGGPTVSALQMMGKFWLRAHPDVRFFEGVVIRWEPRG